MKNFYEYLKRAHNSGIAKTEAYTSGEMKGRLHAIMDAQFSHKAAAYKWLYNQTGYHHVADLPDDVLKKALWKIRKRW